MSDAQLIGAAILCMYAVVMALVAVEVKWPGLATVVLAITIVLLPLLVAAGLLIWGG